MACIRAAGAAQLCFRELYAGRVAVQLAPLPTLPCTCSPHFLFSASPLCICSMDQLRQARAGLQRLHGSSSDDELLASIEGRIDALATLDT